jgi:myo-inositol-1(or 4)-monophosphatase
MSTTASSAVSPDNMSCFSSGCASPTSSISQFSDTSLAFADHKLLDHRLSQLDLEEIQNTLINVAIKAGEMMISADPSVDSSITKKNSSDRVTETDRAIENMVQRTLKSAYPDYEFLGEETFKEGQTLSDEPTFVCDPIDGTLNFIHGFPNTAVSLALTVAKKPVIGVIYNPFRRDLFTAIRGRGAFLKRFDGSSVQLPVKRTPQPLNGLNDCLVAIEWGSQRDGHNWEIRSQVSQKLLSSKASGGAMVHSVRSSGSAALDFCYVAAGWMDAFWEGGCWIWDVCAGWCILEEAGGIVAGANPDEWEPSLEGRSYFAVRGAPGGQREVVEELWSYMDGRHFKFR